MDLRVDGARLAFPLFQAGDSGSRPTSTLQLRFGTCSTKIAKSLNRLWHSRLPMFKRPTSRVAYAAEYDGLFYAVAIWTNPLARMLPQLTWLELNRMAIAPDAPKNTASRMLGWMSRDVKKRFPNVIRIISYQELDYHAGTIYRAAGWSPTERSDGGEWSTVSKPRLPVDRDGPKQRWELALTNGGSKC